MNGRGADSPPIQPISQFCERPADLQQFTCVKPSRIQQVKFVFDLQVAFDRRRGRGLLNILTRLGQCDVPLGVGQILPSRIVFRSESCPLQYGVSLRMLCSSPKLSNGFLVCPLNRVPPGC